MNRRIEVSKLFLDVLDGCDWLVPQTVPENHTNSYWTFVARMTRSDITWHQFRDRFRSMGGDGIYAAWKLTYLEPMFADGCPVRHSTYKGKYQVYGPGLCPVAERIHGQIFQFKTNYWNWDEGLHQADALRRTISNFQ